VTFVGHEVASSGRVSSHSTITAHCSLIILLLTPYRLVTDSSANNKLRIFLFLFSEARLDPSSPQLARSACLGAPPPPDNCLHS
jgi:hypothetical protein